jgi:ribosomal protein S18 acetylase RimI-like enzyme
VAGRAPVVKTYLELADPRELRPPAHPPRRPFELERVRDPALNRWFYETVGADYHWVDRLRWSDRQWRDWEARVETWSVNVAGERAGYYELEPHADRGFCQIAYFGLLAEFHGFGIGGHALTAAIRRAFELAPRVTVSTATTDGPHALANYRARGMRVAERPYAR